MIDRKLLPLLIGLGSSLVSIAAWADQPSARQIAAGRAFAKRVCAACHVVTGEPGETPLLKQPAPSFPAIAQRPNFSSDALREFLSSNHSRVGPHEAMPNPALLGYQIDELIAYFGSLKPAN